MCGGREEGEGGGGGRTAAAAASPRRPPRAPRPPVPPLQQRRTARPLLGPPPPPRRCRETLCESCSPAYLAGAREALQRSGRRAGCAGLAAPSGRSRQRAAGAGSAPASAPLAGACFSRRLTAQVNSIGGRRRGLLGCTVAGGEVVAPGPLVPDFAPDRAKHASCSRSQLSARDFLSAPSPSHRCHRPSSGPPRAPRPSLPLLSAQASGRPLGGAVPGRDIDSCRPRPTAPWAPGPHGCLPRGRARRELQRSASSPQLPLPGLRRGRERPLGPHPGAEPRLGQSQLLRAGSLGGCEGSVRK